MGLLSMIDSYQLFCHMSDAQSCVTVTFFHFLLGILFFFEIYPNHLNLFIQAILVYQKTYRA